ncbi:NAD-dependent epimerase [Rhizobium albus]|nr:NAD-dependent epimerase [Rhizobium albus]
MARYIVTGSTGFLGSDLALHLDHSGHEVIRAGRHSVAHQTMVHFDLGDLTTLSNLAATGADGIFHLAWSTTPAVAEANPYQDIATNVAGTVALFQFARSQKIPIVFVSSGGTVYGNAAITPTPETCPLNPIGAYGLGKSSTEQYADYYSHLGADIRIARVSNPFGEGQSAARLQGVIPIFAKKIAKGEPITIWGDGENLRDYIPARDVSIALTKIMLQEGASVRRPSVFNIGAGIGLSLNRLIAIFEEEIGLKANVKYLDARPFDIQASILDVQRASDLLQWKPSADPESSVRAFARAIQAKKTR